MITDINCEEEPLKVVTSGKQLEVQLDSNNTMQILMNAVQGGLSIEMLEKFMDLAERNEKREAEKAFNNAFAEFKSDPPKIVKDKMVKFGTTNYKHATIGTVVGAIIEGMSKHGLSHRWSIAQNGSNITVTCLITHSLGHSESTSISALADQSGGKNSIQAIASTITYLERYSLQAATGIAVLEEDDDGQSAGNVDHPQADDKKKKSPPAQPPPKEPHPTDRTMVEKWLTWVDSFTKSGATVDQFIEQWDKYAPAIQKLPKEHLEEVIRAKNEMESFLMEAK